ncbi:MAG: hypothetical protein MUF49_01345 [Oculatellaceae cyanobacterium Prado106]|nr:hypothetical protein [Oculatellaceae cyanobacterium Prado106]
MLLPRSPLISDSQIFISGDVTIHPSAAIAPNVLIQADPGARVMIGAGVSIGGGCILHAQQGVIEIEPGATLGSGVLIFGHSQVGMDACIGSNVTIFDGTVAPEYTVPPGSLIGDRSRPVNLAEQPTPPVSTGHVADSSTPAAPEPATATPDNPTNGFDPDFYRKEDPTANGFDPDFYRKDSDSNRFMTNGFRSYNAAANPVNAIAPPSASTFVPPPSNSSTFVPPYSTASTPASPFSSVSPTSPATEPPATSADSATSGNGSAPQNGAKNPIYGQMYLERMLITMFPHRQQLEQQLENPSPEADSTPPPG